MIRPTVMCERSECYIGSTKNTIERRFIQHKHSDSKPSSSKKLFERYGADRLEIIQVEECSEVDRQIRERWWIENTLCINKSMPFRTDEERKEQQKLWEQNNKDNRVEQRRKWRENNPEKYAEQLRRSAESKRLRRQALKNTST